MPIAETRDKFAAARENLAIDKEYRDRWIGVYVGILAMLLALCTMGGGNATKDANRLNIEAANNWNFFQAKNLRANLRNSQAVLLESLPGAERMR